MSTAPRIGIDIGGTSAKLALVSPQGAVLRRAQVPTGRETRPGPLVQELAAAVADLGQGEAASGLGIAAPGFRRADGEGVVNVSNLPGIEGVPLRTHLEQATGLRAVLDNDANAAALGEYRFGAGSGSNRLLVVTVGTGIGAGMVADGTVLRVCAQGLGDPGHVVVQRDGPRCACGGHGCLEAIAAVPAILRRAAEASGGELSFLGSVVEAARAGRDEARSALLDAGRWLGMGLASLVHVLGPDRILLGGGGLDAAEELLLQPVREALYGHVQPYFGERLTLGRVTLGNDAGVIGAAALVADP